MPLAPHIHTMEDRVASLENKMASLQGEIKTLNASVSSLNDLKTKLKQLLHQKTQLSPTYQPTHSINTVIPHQKNNPPSFTISTTQPTYNTSPSLADLKDMLKTCLHSIPSMIPPGSNSSSNPHLSTVHPSLPIPSPNTLFSDKHHDNPIFVATNPSKPPANNHGESSNLQQQPPLPSSIVQDKEVDRACVDEPCQKPLYPAITPFFKIQELSQPMIPQVSRAMDPSPVIKAKMLEASLVSITQKSCKFSHEKKLGQFYLGPDLQLQYPSPLSRPDPAPPNTSSSNHDRIPSSFMCYRRRHFTSLLLATPTSVPPLLSSSTVDSDFLVDRCIIIKLLFTCYQKNNNREVLDPMIRMLGFSNDEQQGIGIAQQGAELTTAAGLPDGDLNIVHGTDDIVNAIYNDDNVRAISFVDSNIAGMQIYARGLAKGNLVQSNMGATNHGIVLPIASMDATLNALGAASGLVAAGQNCRAPSTRVFVGRSKSWEDKLMEYATALQLNVGTVPDAALDPVISKTATTRICRFIEIGFGPMLLCIWTDGLEEAMSIVNTIDNGASIFTSSNIAARTFQTEIEAREVGINASMPVPFPFFSFSGSKASFTGDLSFFGMPVSMALPVTSSSSFMLESLVLYLYGMLLFVFTFALGAG